MRLLSLTLSGSMVLAAAAMAQETVPMAARPDFAPLEPKPQAEAERPQPEDARLLAVDSSVAVASSGIIITPSEGFSVDPYYQDANFFLVADPGFCWVFAVPWEAVAQRCSDLDGCVVRLAGVASLRDSADPTSFQTSGSALLWYLGGSGGVSEQQGDDQEIVITPFGSCIFSDDTFGVSDGNSGSDIRDFSLWDCTDDAVGGVPDNYSDSNCRLTIED